MVDRAKLTPGKQRFGVRATTMKRRLALSFVVLLSCVVVVHWDDSITLMLNKLPYLYLIRQVRSGALRPDVSGTVKLPLIWRIASINGELYVRRDPSGILVAFETLIGGHDRNIAGFLYSDFPLDTSIVYEDYYGRPTVDVGPLPLTLTKKLNSHWYKVKFDLD